MYGLNDSDIEAMRSVFKTEKHLERVVLYGSRAKGNYKPFSDVDITLMGHNLTSDDVSRLAIELDDLLLPYNMDISHYSSLSNQQLIDHINRRGVALYEV
ncbi:MAG: nucleotidyltransferase domain-containing protein [Paludibacteraceae bacterium]|nr:nucleotidyltransferase domain-containing protein [Paludibacteraceae bacterium]